MNFDAVAIGAIVAVALSIVVVVFLMFKIKSLMNQDAEKQE